MTSNLFAIAACIALYCAPFGDSTDIKSMTIVLFLMLMAIWAAIKDLDKEGV